MKKITVKNVKSITKPALISIDVCAEYGTSILLKISYDQEVYISIPPDYTEKNITILTAKNKE